MHPGHLGSSNTTTCTDALELPIVGYSDVLIDNFIDLLHPDNKLTVTIRAKVVMRLIAVNLIFSYINIPLKRLNS